MMNPGAKEPFYNSGSALLAAANHCRLYLVAISAARPWRTPLSSCTRLAGDDSQALLIRLDVPTFRPPKASAHLALPHPARSAPAPLCDALNDGSCSFVSAEQAMLDWCVRGGPEQMVRQWGNICA
jgi:hypothetical protein